MQEVTPLPSFFPEQQSRLTAESASQPGERVRCSGLCQAVADSRHCDGTLQTVQQVRRAICGRLLQQHLLPQALLLPVAVLGDGQELLLCLALQPCNLLLLAELQLLVERDLLLLLLLRLEVQGSCAQQALAQKLLQ